MKGVTFSRSKRGTGKLKISPCSTKYNTIRRGSNIGYVMGTEVRKALGVNSETPGPGSYGINISKNRSKGKHKINGTMHTAKRRS